MQQYCSTENFLYTKFYEVKIGVWCTMDMSWIVGIVFYAETVILRGTEGRYCSRFSGNWQTKILDISNRIL